MGGSRADLKLSHIRKELRQDEYVHGAGVILWCTWGMRNRKQPDLSSQQAHGSRIKWEGTVDARAGGTCKDGVAQPRAFMEGTKMRDFESKTVSLF